MGKKKSEQKNHSSRDTGGVPEDLQLVLQVTGPGDAELFIRHLTGMELSALPVEKGLVKGTQVYDLSDEIFVAVASWPGGDGRSFRPEPAADLLVWLGGGEELQEALPALEALAREKDLPVLVVLPAGTSPTAVPAEGLTLHHTGDDAEDDARMLTRRMAALLAARGKEMLFLRVARQRATVLVTWVMGAAATAFGVAALGAGAATPLLTSLQSALCLRLASVYGQQPQGTLLEELLALPALSAAGRRLSHHLTGLLDQARLPRTLHTLTRATLHGVLAAALTYGLGMTCLAYFQSGMGKKMEDLVTIIRQFAEEYLRDHTGDRPTPASTRPDAPA